MRRKSMTPERAEELRRLVIKGARPIDLVGLFPEATPAAIKSAAARVRREAKLPPLPRGGNRSKSRNGALAINDAILRGESPEAIRAAAERILPSKLGRPPKAELKPMSTEQCKRVLKVLEKIAEADPAAFTHLGIWQTLTAKFPDKLLEVF